MKKKRKLNLLLALPAPLLVTQIKILMLSICEPCVSFCWKPLPIPGFPGYFALVLASSSACVGSAPAVVIMRMGMPAVESALKISEREEEALEQIEEDIKEYNRNMMESIQSMVATINGTLKDEKDDPQQLPKTLLTKEQSIFNIPSNMTPKFINIHCSGEAASKVLFSTVHWARQLPYFSALHSTNKSKILKRCWLDLFVRRAACPPASSSVACKWQD